MNEKEFLDLVEKYKKKKKTTDDGKSTGVTTSGKTDKNTEAFISLVEKYKAESIGNRLDSVYERKPGNEITLTDKVKEEEEKIDKKDDGGLDFFQASGDFRDGYNVGDVVKTVLGTAGDAGLNVAKGAGSLVEGVADLGMYAASAIADKAQGDGLETKAQMEAEYVLDHMLSERDFNAYAQRLGHKGTYEEYVADVKAQAQEILDNAKSGGVAASIKETAQKNTVDDLTAGAQKFLDGHSVLGNTSKGVFQGVGQVAGIMATGGLGAAAGFGATATTTATSLLSSWGNNMSQAYQEGASDADAWTYGAIAGAVDAGTELLFGGLGKQLNAVGYSKGLTQADDILAKKVTSKITNQIAKNFAEYGIKAGAEGFEEVLAGTLQAITKGFTYKETEEEWTLENIEETLKHFASLIEDENLLEQFVVGAVTSGIAQSGYVPGMTEGSLREANKTGKDFITGQTQNEQAVIKKETEKRIAEAEKDGTKLTGRQKSNIEAQVESDLEKGYISTDTIEEVLGGDSYKEFKDNVEGFMNSDTYKSYKDSVAEEKALQEEFEQLQKVKLTEADLGQQSRFTEVKNRLEEIKKEAKSAKLRKELDAEIERINGIKSKLRDEVTEKVKNERLVESYKELVRSTEKFQADPAEYDNEYARKTVENIVKSGIANNTNETHEFVSMMAKISADKGVVFSLTDAERLAGTRYAKDGAVTNAYVTSEGDIVINNDSKKRLNSLVGHEVTHVLEGSQLYGELQKAVFDYAQKKGEYDSRLKAITDLYQKYDPKADPKKELTADLVGDYLFTDKDFINKLSTENRNVFQKIYDEIKYLFKVATAGSKEARALEKAKKMFEEAYRENVKGKPQTDSFSFGSQSDSKHIDKYTQKQYNDFGWARHIDAISKNELDDLYSKIQEKGSLKKFAQSGYGEAIVEVNDKPHTTLGVDNVFVFVTGTKNSPKITKVARFQVETETEMATIKEYLYERRTLDNTYYEILKEIGAAKEYRRESSLDYTQYIEKTRQGSRGTEGGRTDRNSGLLQNGSGTFAEAQTNEIAPTKEASSTDDAFFDGNKPGVKYSLSAVSGSGGAYADTFYSQMSKVIDDIKQEKLGAEEAINKIRRGKGVKAEEIKWSGIEQFLEGKRSVTKRELQDFVRNNRLEIEEESLDDKELPYTAEQQEEIEYYNQKKDAAYDRLARKWEDTYKEKLQINREAAGVGSMVEDKLRQKLFATRENTPEGIAYKEARESLKEIIAKYDDFGFDTAKEAYVMAVKDPTGFALAEEMDSVDAAFFDRFARVQESFRKVDLDSLADENAPLIQAIADQAQFFSKKIQDIKSAHYAEQAKKMPKWREYKLEGGSNYRELLFKLPGSNYNNTMMNVHWENRNGVLAHARLQDFDTPDGKMLFVEEIQSDWHNAGSKFGYDTDPKDVQTQLENQIEALSKEQEEINWNESDAGERNEVIEKKLQQLQGDLGELKASGTPPSAPYANSYTDFVMKRLLRMAAEEGYNKIGWTTADIQSERWSDQYTKGYQIEYDQDIPKFLRGYGKKWGAIVEKTYIGTGKTYDKEIANLLDDIVTWKEDFASAQDQSERDFIQSQIDYINEEIAEYRSRALGTEVWSMPITEEMKSSVLYEGQPWYSLSSEAEDSRNTGGYAVYGENIRVRDEAELGFSPIKEPAQEIPDVEGPVREDVPTQEPIEEILPDDGLPGAETDIDSLTDADVPPEVDAPYYDDANEATPADPFENRDIKEVGNRKVNAYMYENPEVKPFFQEEANIMLGELERTTKGERFYNMDVYYDTNGEAGITGTSRHTSQDIAYLLDELKYSYKQIEAGLKAIIEDNGKENNAVSKRIEFLLNDRLLNGYQDADHGWDYPPNQDYIKLLNEKQITEYNEEARNALFASGDEYAPVVANVSEQANAQSLEALENLVASVGDSGSWGDYSWVAEAPTISEDYTTYITVTNNRTNKVLKGETGILGSVSKTVAELIAKDQNTAEAPVRKTSVDDIGPVAYEAIRPKPTVEGPVASGVNYGDKLVRVDSNNGRPGEKRRKWVGTSTESEAVGRKVLPDDLNQDTIHYQPISNKETLGKANGKLDGMGYEKSVEYFNAQFSNRKVSLEDIALGERLIQEAIKKGDTKTAGELIQEVAILGTELGQKVQALSIIKRLTPEGQLQMLQRVVERGKTKGDKAYEGVEFTQEMIDKILAAYGKDGTYDQDKLNAAVEDVKQQIADQMKVTVMDKVNAWRYLSMLGNPKTHIRNLISNVAMRGTVAVKNTLARTIETFAPIGNRTKTWKGASEEVKAFARNTAVEMKDILSDDSKYSEDASIKDKRQIFKNKVLNGVYEFNSDWLSKEDWWFSKPAFVNSLSEFLAANGISTKEDIQNNPELIEKAKLYATEQSQIATFRQYSWLASKISDIERRNTATDIVVGAVLPFKKTPINVAKAGLNYSPLGFAKTLTYDIAKVKSGKMEASTLIDHLSQNVTGTALALIGYALARSGFISGGGEDDKEGKFDSRLGAQSYAVNIGGQSYSLSWLSPVAMPLFVGANAYEQLEEGKEWNGDVVVETLAQTLDPLNEMSFLSGLNQVLSSYDSGMQKFAGIGEAMVQNYVTQFVPTLSSQVAAVTDDTKRTTKVAGDSGFKAFDGIVNQIKYKIPGLRQTLEPSIDIWGNEVKQSENVMQRAFDTFLAPYSTKSDISTAVDEEIKTVYGDTGENEVIPTTPDNYVNYKADKYKMSDDEYTKFKKQYGKLSYQLLRDLFDNQTYINATESEKADMIGKVYDFARDEAKKQFLSTKGVEYTNTTSEGVPVYKQDPIKGAIDNDMTPEEYGFYNDNPEKYDFLKNLNVSYADYSSFDEDTKEAYNWAYNNPEGYAVSKAVTNDIVEYKQYTKALNDLKADKDASGKTISGSRKDKVLEYVGSLDLELGQKLILMKSEYPSDDNWNYEIIDYINSRADLGYEDAVTILKKLGFNVSSNGTITW